MLYLLGSEKTLTTSFADVVAKSMQTTSIPLKDDALEPELQNMNNTTPILIEKGFSAGAQQECLLKTIREKNVPVIMTNCDPGDLEGYTAVCPKGKYVAVKNKSNGRRQEILVIDNKEISIQCEIKQTNGIVKKTGESTGSKVNEEQVTTRLIQFLKNEQKETKSEPGNYWEHCTTIRFEQWVDNQPTHSSLPGWLNDRLKNGFVKAFCTIDVTLYATKQPRQKWIKYQLTDAVGMSAKMTSDDRWAKGWFNHSANIYIYPGSGSDPNDSQLPGGWTRPYIAPLTPNSKTNYTSTTGWSFGVKGGIDSKGPSAEVTASYSQRDQVQQTIEDFRVRNRSDASMTGWDFYYTAMDGNSWEKHFTPHDAPQPIADLAKSTLTLNSEAIYRGPPDENECIPWSFQFIPKWGCLRGNFFMGWLYTLWITLELSATIDMAMVVNPEP